MLLFIIVIRLKLITHTPFDTRTKHNYKQLLFPTLESSRTLCDDIIPLSLFILLF